MDKEQDLAALRAGYNRYIRAFEFTSIIVNISFCLYFLVTFKLDLLSYPLIIFVSWLLADIVSGVVHWFADTFGKVEWPILGNTFIRSFHEHHLDPKSITRHDWIETNGNNFFIGIPALFLIFVLKESLSPAVIIGVCFLNIWTSLTNQFHKWAHQSQGPTWVNLLQKWRIITNRKEHITHHRKPHHSSYNITSGILNPILDKFRFYRMLEAVGENLFSLKNNRKINNDY